MHTPAVSSPWLVNRKARPGAPLRLFCFPYSGGGAAAFRGWAEAMPGLEVIAVQPPGRETRLHDPVFTRLDPLVAALLKEIRPHLDRPFAFFGHSLGAFVALELMRALRREEGPMPRHFFASGCPSPQSHVVERPIHALPQEALIDALRRYRGTPEEVLRNAELMELLLPAVRADFAAFETYRPASDAPLDLPITAFGGMEDEHATPEEVEGWRDHTSRGFARRMFPGHHFFIHEERARLIGAVLADLAPHLR